MDQNEWINISYTLPREPSRVRVSVWRKLKRIGAVNIQQSMWVLPLTENNYSLFNEIKEEISNNGGEAFLMQSTVDENSRKTIIEKFRVARDEEYQELIEECDAFFAEIDKEIRRENFSFAEIEENEEELNKLKEWYGKIVLRDFFGAPLRGKAKEMLVKCAEDLERFCDMVYDFTEIK